MTGQFKARLRTVQGTMQGYLGYKDVYSLLLVLPYNVFGPIQTHKIDCPVHIGCVVLRRGTGEIILRVLVTDNDDLAVVSSLSQDAVVRVGDIRHDHRAKTVLVTMNRFCWEAKRFIRPRRSRAALQINGVLSIRAKGIAQGKQNGVLSLLHINFEALEDEAPSGMVQMVFSDKATLAIEVEMLDMLLLDISGPWGAKSRPKHDG